MRMLIYHTTTSPSIELTSYLSKLWVLAAYAKAANKMSLYNQAKDIHDRLVLNYNEQVRPKKKGFWQQFKDNITFRDLDTHCAITLEYLEENSTFQTIYEAVKQEPSYKLIEELNRAVTEFNQNH